MTAWTDRRTWLWMAGLLAVSLAVRAVFLALLPASPGLPSYDMLYLDALRDHTWEYLAYTPRKPPLFSVLQLPVVWLFDNQTIASWRLLTVELFVLDSAAMAGIVLVVRALGGLPSVAALAAGLYSLCLMPVELMGTHYDRPYVFFAVMFLLAAAIMALRPSLRSAVALSVAGGLLVAQSTVGSLVVPVMAVLALALGPWQLRRLAVHGVVALSLPLCVVAGLTAKNMASSGISATANGAGHAQILYVSVLYDWKVPKLRQVLAEAGAPAWYLWCFDHPSHDDTPDDVFARTLGACANLSRADEFDLSPVRQAMAAMGEQGMVELVDRDMAMMRDKPWMAAPFGWAATRWFSKYSAENVRMAKKIFQNQTAAWLRQARLIHQNMWLMWGARSLGQYAEEYWPEPGAPVPMASLLRSANRTLASLTRATYLAIPWLAGLLVVGWALPRLFSRLRHGDRPVLWLVFSLAAVFDAAASRCGRKTRAELDAAVAARWRNGDLAAIRPSRSMVATLLLTAVPVIIMTVIFCATVGTENERFFQQVIPYLVVLAGVTVSSAVRMALGTAARG